jgi:hypothetical protein
MLSNEPLERLINTLVALEGQGVDAQRSRELRCLWRKIDWVAQEAESTLQLLTPGRAEPQK